MIVLMAGLPGSGKSTLSRELAARTSGRVLNKDEIRSALFPPSAIEYSREQDDFCIEVALAAAGYILRREPQRLVFLDGRTFSRRSQIDVVLQAAQKLGQPWRILECVCSEETARRRIEAQREEHPAGDRDFALYLRIRAAWEEITLPKTMVNTEQELEICVVQALQGLV
jgi:adenylylsulfate kinase